jgi:hypothetical protein
MVVEIEKLREIIESILNHISGDLGIAQVELDEDFYWSVDSSFLYKANEKPSNFDLGSLLDDWDFLSDLPNDKDQAVSLMLTHVAPLLRYVGEKIQR